MSLSASNGVPKRESENTGHLLDGTPISEAIIIIDNTVRPRPIWYMANCVHPSNLKQALNQPFNKNSPNLSRFIGLQANASSLSPEELDQIYYLDLFDDRRFLCCYRLINPTGDKTTLACYEGVCFRKSLCFKKQ